MRWPARQEPDFEWQAWKEKFAWLPVKIRGQWIWMEHYERRRKCFMTQPCRDYIYDRRVCDYPAGWP